MRTNNPYIPVIAPPPYTTTTPGERIGGGIAPAFVRFAGLEAPKLTDFGSKGADRASKKSASKLPMHVKPHAVRTFDREGFGQLKSQHLTDALQELTWIHDIRRFTTALARAKAASIVGRDLLRGHCSLLLHDLEVFRAVRKIEVEEQLERVIATCNVFAVIETLKHRRRGITEPLINDFLLKEEMSRVVLPSRSRIRQLMQEHAFFCQYDSAAFYDQFELSLEVSRVFAFCAGSGSQRQWFRQRTLPMGFRPSCAVAQAVSKVLADVSVAGVVPECYIDNYFFFATSRAAIEEASRIFKERCKLAGVVLNEDGGAIVSSSEASAQVEVLGERYDMHRRTRTITDSVREKLQAAVHTTQWQRTQSISCRNMAAVYGILFFASANFGYAPKAHFDALYFYRQLSRYAQEKGWSSAAPRLPMIEDEQISDWLLRMLAHAPVPITSSAQLPDRRVTFDACELGWGAVIECGTTGATSFFALPWDSSTRDSHHLQSSVVSEPLAAFRAACVAVVEGVRHVRLVSDHEPLVRAGERGYAAARSYNALFVALERSFPDVHFSYEFVPGSRNRADPWSRGLCGWSGIEEPRVLCGVDLFPEVSVGDANFKRMMQGSG